MRDRASPQQMIRVDPQRFQHPHEQVDVILAAVKILAIVILHDVQCGHRTGNALHGHAYAFRFQHMRDDVGQHRNHMSSLILRQNLDTGTESVQGSEGSGDRVPGHSPGTRAGHGSSLRLIDTRMPILIMVPTAMMATTVIGNTV